MLKFANCARLSPSFAVGVRIRFLPRSPSSASEGNEVLLILADLPHGLARTSCTFLVAAQSLSPAALFRICLISTLLGFGNFIESTFYVSVGAFR